jgi:hypothetical protein
VSVAASDYYFNESSGPVSDGLVVLYGLSDLSAISSLNVNLLTMLAYQRTRRNRCAIRIGVCSNV